MGIYFFGDAIWDRKACVIISFESFLFLIRFGIAAKFQMKGRYAVKMFRDNISHECQWACQYY